MKIRPALYKNVSVSLNKESSGLTKKNELFQVRTGTCSLIPPPACPLAWILYGIYQAGTMGAITITGRLDASAVIN
jgi:hypothetical protein